MKTHHHQGFFTTGLIIGAAAGALGGAFLYAKRNALRGALWELRARAEVLRRVHNLKRVTRSAYEDIVDDVLERYRELETVAAYELDGFADTLKEQWSEVKQGIEAATKNPDDEDEE